MTERFRNAALSRWEDEGGALSCGPHEALAAACEASGVRALSDMEIIQLRVRVIALENIVLGLLSRAEDSALEAVEQMAAMITPRPGAKQHPLTVQAAGQIGQLVERARRLAG